MVNTKVKILKICLSGVILVQFLYVISAVFLVNNYFVFELAYIMLIK